ncbi:MAG TPA: hypothetical protein VGH27_20675 [Streptosporangiaceae bacterium]|jgi:hypothetical protein
MTEQPVAVLQGNVTIANATLGGKTSWPQAKLLVYPDRLEFTRAGIFGAKTVTQSRESIKEVYPLVVRSVLRWHPGLLGKYLIRVVTKCSNVYEGSPSYWFFFRMPSPDTVLGILASAGYPVDREPRIAGLMSGEDRKLPSRPAT